MKGLAKEISPKLHGIAGGNPITEMLLQKRLSTNGSQLDLTTVTNPEVAGRNGSHHNQAMSVSGSAQNPGSRFSLQPVESRKELRKSEHSPLELEE